MNEGAVTIVMSRAEALELFSQLPPMYSIEQIAAQYGVAHEYVRLEIKAGNLDAVMIGKEWKCSPGAVREWLDGKKKSRAS